MEFVVLERMPLPKLSTYVIVSVIATICSVFHINQYLSTSEYSEINSLAQIDGQFQDSCNYSLWKQNIFNAEPRKCLLEYSKLKSSSNAAFLSSEYVLQFISEFSKSDWCMWSIINMAYCSLVLLGKSIQHLAFGDLRLSEHQHVREKFWNFVFYKFIFIFGVLNVQTFDEVLLWMAWFSALGFLHLLTTLIKVRFEYLTFSPMSNSKQHLKLLLLTCIVWLLSIPMTYFAVFFGLDISVHVMCFMLAEVLLLNLVTFQVFAHQMIHVFSHLVCRIHHTIREDHSHSRISTIGQILRQFIGNYEANYSPNEENSQLNRFALMSVKNRFDLVLDVSILLIDILHHFHMLLWSNIFLSMASLVVLMQLRYLYSEFSKRIRGYRKYKKLMSILQHDFPEKSVPDSESEVCAICWDPVYHYHSLPCAHIFHEMCLYAWVSQDPTCPICRQIIDGLKFNPETEGVINRAMNVPFIDAIEDMATELGFQEDDMVVEELPPDDLTDTEVVNSSSWFSFTQLFRAQFWVQFFSDQALNPTQSFNNTVDAQNLIPMSRQLHAIFRHISLQLILQDLHRTRNTETTIENILEGRLSEDNQSGEEVQTVTEYNHDTTMRPLQQHNPSDSVMIPPFEESSSTDLSNEHSNASFSLSSSERESSLQDRKRQLVLQARQRYINQHSL